jgi:hypothetical protein
VLKDVFFFLGYTRNSEGEENKTKQKEIKEMKRNLSCVGKRLGKRKVV